jgi:hypothetical protein
VYVLVSGRVRSSTVGKNVVYKGREGGENRYAGNQRDIDV